MKVYLDSIGCRLNQAEIETYARQLRALGHTLVAEAGEADLSIVNTCAVTAAAAADSRQKIRRMARSGAGQVVVTGCWSTLRPEEAAALPGVQRVVANEHKDELVAELMQVPPEIFDLEPVERRPVPGARLKTRAFIKVQDGCDNHCTFCVTTLARGPGRSRRLSQVLAEVQAAVAGGAQEVVLTGVHLGSWGQEHGAHVSDLIRAVLNDTSVVRLRLSSLEPWDLDAEFFALWQERRLCRHLHLPLQSGCAATLRRMARKTSPDAFAGLVAAARGAVPGMAITTDVIVGFPGESESEFVESLEFVQALHLAGGHVFTYSPRPGTGAARLRSQVPERARKERSERMRQVLVASAGQYEAAFIGQTLPVLWESAVGLDQDGWEMSGLTDNYLRITARAPQALWNTITPVALTGQTQTGLYGNISFP